MDRRDVGAEQPHINGVTSEPEQGPAEYISVTELVARYHQAQRNAGYWKKRYWAENKDWQQKMERAWQDAYYKGQNAGSRNTFVPTRSVPWWEFNSWRKSILLAQVKAVLMTSSAAILAYNVWYLLNH